MIAVVRAGLLERRLASIHGADVHGCSRLIRPSSLLVKRPMLQQIDIDLWVTERAHRYLGVQIEIRMTVIKLADGTLFVHSPVRLDEITRASLDKLGPVKHVVAPNRFHHLYVSDYPKNYPDAKIYGAPGLDTKRCDLHFDAILGDIPPPVWSGQIDQSPRCVARRAAPTSSKIPIPARAARPIGSPAGVTVRWSSAGRRRSSTPSKASAGS